MGTLPAPLAALGAGALRSRSASPPALPAATEHGHSPGATLPSPN